ncbi:MAG: hypothetical protein K2U26_16095, partial [Cyclobacteriaceae bacterium]|nr:hypothetical protein [Cyclobacteriaceae bacterium]
KKPTAFNQKNRKLKNGDIKMSFSKLPISNTKQSNSNTVSRTFSNFQLTIGKEFQKKLVKHWMWYGGGDIVGTYTKSTGDIPIQENTSYGAILRPFLGVRFNINSRLYISTEASINLVYTTAKGSQIQNGVTTEISGDGFSFGASAATGIFFFYRF